MIYLKKNLYLGYSPVASDAIAYYMNKAGQLSGEGAEIYKGIAIAKKRGYIKKNGNGHQLTKFGKAMVKLTQ